MTATNTNEPGTALAKNRPALSPELQARIDERRLQSAMVQKIRGATWGNQWDAHTIAAVATWARENDVEPITEIDMLGGNLYLKARHYERKLSQLIAADQIEYARKDWVHVDARLETMAAAGDRRAIDESARRTFERIKYNLSDAADAACVYRIKHRLMTDEVTGAKEHVPGKRKDPVGDAMPMETVETRALRRAMLQLKESLPSLRLAATNDDAFVGVEEVVQENHARLKAARTVPEAEDVEAEESRDLTDAEVAAQDAKREGGRAG
jgi:hypothetical protein